MQSDKHCVPVIGPVPKLSPYHVTRPRLRKALLNSLADRQIALIHAPAGFGKSTLLVECAHHASGRVVYARFEPTYADPLAPIQVFLQALASLEPIAPEQTDEPLLVIIDDYPVTGDAIVDEQLEWCLDRCPPTWRVILSSRGQPNLPLARWAAEDRLTVWTQRELAFTVDEAQHIASSILGRPLQPQEATLFHNNFDGWVLGWKLGLEALRTQSVADTARILDADGGLIWVVEEYFEREVMQKQLAAPTEADFLYRTTILSELAVDICNPYLGLQNVGEMLRSLERRGLFLTRLDPAGTIYEYHPAFKAFLHHHTRQKMAASAIQSLHQRAAEMYEQRGAWHRAIHHYLLAETYDAAVRLIEQRGVELLDRPTVVPEIPYVRPQRLRDQVDIMWQWLNRLPPQLLEERAPLQFLMGRILHARGGHHEARAMMQRALEKVRGQGDPIEEAKIVVNMALVDFADGHFAEAIDRIRHILPQTEEVPSVQVEALLALSLSLAAQAQMRQAIEAAEAGLQSVGQVLDRQRRASLEMRTARHLAYLYRDIGELEAAAAMADRAACVQIDEKVTEIDTQHQNIRAQMLVQIASGHLDDARRIGQEWRRLLAGLPGDTEYSSQLMALEGRIALLDQEYGPAEIKLVQTSSFGSDLTQLRLLQGRHDEALQLAELELVRQGADAPPLSHAIAQMWLGIVESQAGNYQRGLKLVTESVAFFSAHELRFWQAGAELHLAWLLAQTGQHDQAQCLVESALAYGARAFALYLAFWHPHVIAFACREALVANTYTTYAIALASQRLRSAQAHPFQALVQHPDARVRMQARSILDSLGVAAYPPAPFHSRVSLNPRVEKLVQQGRLTQLGATRLGYDYSLTPREIEVFTWYVEPGVRTGGSRVNQAIAQRLHLSETTVRDYVSVILKKLEAPGRDRLHLRAWALAAGIVPS